MIFTYIALPGAFESWRRFERARETAIRIGIGNVVERPIRGQLFKLIAGSWAFDRPLVCHLTTRIADVIQEVRRLSHGQVTRDLMSQNYQKRSMLQTLLAGYIAGLEPQEQHHLRDTWCLFDQYVLDSNTSPWLATPGDATLCQCVLQHCQFCEFLLAQTGNCRKMPGLIALCNLESLRTAKDSLN